MLSEKQIKILARKISEFEFSTRIVNACYTDSSIVYLYQLAQKSPQEVWEIPNLGLKSLREIQETLDDDGLTLSLKISDFEMENIQRVLRGEDIISHKDHVASKFTHHIVVEQYIRGEWVELIVLDVSEGLTHQSVAADVLNGMIIFNGKETVVITKQNGPVKIKDKRKVKKP